MQQNKLVRINKYELPVNLSHVRDQIGIIVRYNYDENDPYRSSFNILVGNELVRLYGDEFEVIEPEKTS